MSTCVIRTIKEWSLLEARKELITHFGRMRGFFQEVRRQNFPDVEFVDLSKLDSITNEDFLDAAHLNSKGARKVSSWLNEWITTN